MNKLNANYSSLFLEELQKRVTVPDGEFEHFLELWDFKPFKRNAFILKAGEVPEFSY